jgi:nucleotide-binding universal stress UspA family protein
MFKSILVGYDGSNSSKKALQRAAIMAKEYDARLKALWVREPPPRYSDLPGESEEQTDAAQEYFKERQGEVEAVAKQFEVVIDCKSRSGHPAKTIVTAADEDHCDLIVIGHSDHSGLWGRLLGDTADRVSDHAHCSVLIVKS